jgi:hypothetical protein
VRFIWRVEGLGPEESVEVTGIYRVREGRILAVEHFWDHAEALKAAGLAG